jgi:tetratricopeptide (TPR) repeat protein
LRICLIYAGAALILFLVAAFARKTHESVVSYGRGLRHLENDLNDRAIEEFNRAIASDPAFAQAHNVIGVAYLRKESYEQAINAFKKCLELNPDVSVREMAQYNLGVAYLSLSRNDEAIGAFNQSLQHNSQDPETHHFLGMAYLGKKLYDQAITAFQQSIKLKPDLVGPQIGLGEAYEAKGLRDQAIAAYEEALKLDPAAEEVQQKLNELKANRTPAAPASRH